MKEAVLIVAKNALFHAVCLGNVERYLGLKGRVMIAAAKLHLYEASYMKLLRLFVREGAVVVDIGANFGAYTQHLAALVGPAGRVFAFEPVPPVAAALERACSRMPNVTVIREAVSDRNHGEVPIHVPYLPGRVPEPALARIDTAPANRTDHDTWRTFRVPARALDDRVEQLRGVSFIKADIEGHEAEFLTGAAATIRAFRPIIQIESAGIASRRSTVLTFARERKYVLLGLLNGRLRSVTDAGELPLNVYLVPGEAADAIAASHQNLGRLS
ncbi:MAG: FkbM family methyltransferase [Acidobacteriota bacterium]|nr:FkbM family methyltransferase [Acidobacteriota bacterium]